MSDQQEDLLNEKLTNEVRRPESEEQADNLKLWHTVCDSPKEALKEVSGTGRGKFTSIDPYYQIGCATKLWGPYGVKWGMRDTKIEEMTNGEGVFLHCYFFFPHDGRSHQFPYWNSMKLGDSRGMDGDLAKKIQTDTITKCLSLLGFNADVFMGANDDMRRYVAMKKALDDEPETTTKPQVKEKPNSKEFPKGMKVEEIFPPDALIWQGGDPKQYTHFFERMYDIGYRLFQDAEAEAVRQAARQIMLNCLDDYDLPRGKGVVKDPKTGEDRDVMQLTGDTANKVLAYMARDARRKFLAIDNRLEEGQEKSK